MSCSYDTDCPIDSGCVNSVCWTPPAPIVPWRWLQIGIGVWIGLFALLSVGYGSLTPIVVGLLVAAAVVGGVYYDLQTRLKDSTAPKRGPSMPSGIYTFAQQIDGRTRYLTAPSLTAPFLRMVDPGVGDMGDPEPPTGSLRRTMYWQYDAPSRTLQTMDPSKLYLHYDSAQQTFKLEAQPQTFWTIGPEGRLLGGDGLCVQINSVRRAKMEPSVSAKTGTVFDLLTHMPKYQCTNSY